MKEMHNMSAALGLEKNLKTSRVWPQAGQGVRGTGYFCQDVLNEEFLLIFSSSCSKLVDIFLQNTQNSGLIITQKERKLKY